MATASTALRPPRLPAVAEQASPLHRLPKNRVVAVNVRRSFAARAGSYPGNVGVPKQWYNLIADLPVKPPPMLHPGTHQPLNPSDLAPLFPDELIRQELTEERFIDIPDEVRDVYELWRPTPLIRAKRLEKLLGTPAKIYYKYEGTSPAGSHKGNTAVPQAWYNAAAGVKNVVTETGAGQWGSALSFASTLFGLNCEVWQVRASYDQKPYRRLMMETWGAKVHPSPSDVTEAGRRLLAADPSSPGSLGMAISEAVEVAATNADTKYCLGSVLNHVLLHQTVIGEECLEQLAAIGDTPDVVIGCTGGGSNFGGLAFPFMREKLAGRMNPQFKAVEPAACPTLTKGVYTYDYGDTAGLTPLMKMHTLGHDFVPDPIHAGGLRYHGMAPLISHVYELGFMEAMSIQQTECFEAAIQFARTEGIIPAPEPTHAIAAAIREALECKRTAAFSDPGPSTRDVSIRGREIGAPISASMGSMRPLVGKLDMLLQAPLLRRCSNSKRFKRVEDGIGLLKDDVQKMGSYLDQLSEVEDPPLAANCWMNEARNLSYDMEDYIDSLIFVGPENPSLVPDNIKATRSGLKFSFCLKFLGHAKSPKTQVVSIAETLSEFRMYVLEAIERHQRYNLHSYSTLKRRLVPVGPTLPIPTQYDEEASHIVIDGWTSKFINSLVDDVGEDQQLKVVSILGPSCLGKTTLANVLYSRIGKQYHCRAFVRVSKKPDMKRIFCDIFSQLQLPDHPWDFRETDLIDSIKKYLQNKRNLIIIDDLWETSVWDLINQAFPKGSQGSRIVTTTQIENVAIACCCYQSEHVFEMQPLDDDHSKKLFFNRLFGSESDCPDELKQVCDEITEICDGLPLATICIASLLLSQPVMSNDLFTYIHQSLISCFSAVPTSERTRQALNLSYNNLPRYLKTCLLYLNMYPEGYTFLKDDLVKQWVAEGLIYATEGQDIEKVAESYLYQLIGRSFIQPICVSYNKEVLSCQVHDMIHDLIAHKSAEENFIVAIDYRCRKNVSLSHKVRRLSLVFGDARYAKTPANIRNSQVRSVRFSGLLESMPCLTEFKLVRVLNLQLSGQGCHDDDIADLTGIAEMFQLRYLKIACDVCIKLPSHVLQYLGTLDITDARLAPVPWDVNFPRLLHLHLSLPVQRDLLDGIDRIRSPSLMSIGKVNNLQELHLTISSLSTFQHVAKNIEALGSLLGGHGNLKTIAVAHASSVINTAASKSNILWDCMEPPPLLQRFEFSPHSSCIFSQVPLWVGKLGNLCILKIAVRELMMNSVDILRGLPALTALSLYVQTPPDDNIIFDTAGFSVLKYFKFTFMRGIACVKFEADAMPNLWKLKLVFNIIPPMDQQLILCSNHPQWKTYGHGTALISIDYMPGVREIFTKFGGAAADLEYVSRTGVISNHPSNPIIDVQLADSGSYADESTETEITSTNEILEERPDEIIKSGSRNTSPGR